MKCPDRSKIRGTIGKFWRRYYGVFRDPETQGAETDAIKC